MSFAAFAAVSIGMPASGCEGLVDGPRGTVVSVVDGDSVVLDTGMTVRLIGTQAPKLPLDRPEFTAWPMAAQSKEALSGLVLGKKVRLAFGGARADRHQRVLAHMFIDDQSATWVQQAMLAAGMARVYSFADNRACVDQLLASERTARAERLGIWADPYYAIRSAQRPGDLAATAGTFQIVEGRVLDTGSAGRYVYLNFGRYWKEDFTVAIDSRAQRLFAEAGLDPQTLSGALVRVRGWIENRDGPRIDVTHPEQIEVLSVK